MRCKQGDLAFVARVTYENIRPYLGRVVRCVRLKDGDCWMTEPELEPGRAVYDGALEPIRGDEGTDETLLWKPVPLPQIEGQPA